MSKEKEVNFYLSLEWRSLRYRALLHYGRKCMLCNATNKELHVDHIKPVSLYPNLRFSFDNLQVLCKDCNLGKSNMDKTDFRSEESKVKVRPKEPELLRVPSVSSAPKFMVTRTKQHVIVNNNTLCKVFADPKLLRPSTFKATPDNGVRFCKVCLRLWTKK